MIIEKWVAQTPVGFKFCPKLYRQITHQGLLTPVIPDALSFLSRMSGLGDWAQSTLRDRLGTIFIQLPRPQEVHSPNTAKYFFSLLQQQCHDVPNLPWNEIEPQPTQLNLF